MHKCHTAAGVTLTIWYATGGGRDAKTEQVRWAIKSIDDAAVVLLLLLSVSGLVMLLIFE